MSLDQEDSNRRDKRVSIDTPADLVIRLAGNSAESVCRKPRPADIRLSVADISRARQFSYSSKHDLEQGQGTALHFAEPGKL